MTLHFLKFDGDSKDNAIEAATTDRLGATVRYDDERGIEEGDDIVLTDPGCVAFGRATVVEVADLPVYRAWRRMWANNYMHPSEDPGELASTLDAYYDDEIHMETEVRVIAYRPDLAAFIHLAESGCACGRSENARAAKP